MRILLANLTKMVDDTGGLAKVTASFANEMHRRGHSVSLVYSDVRTGNFYYPVDMAVETYDLCHYEGKSKSIPLWYKLKRELLRSIDTRKARAVNNDFTKNYLLDNLKSVLNRTDPDVWECFLKSDKHSDLTEDFSGSFLQVWNRHCFCMNHLCS